MSRQRPAPGRRRNRHDPGSTASGGTLSSGNAPIFSTATDDDRLSSTALESHGPGPEHILEGAVGSETPTTSYNTQATQVTPQTSTSSGSAWVDVHGQSHSAGASERSLGSDHEPNGLHTGAAATGEALERRYVDTPPAVAASEGHLGPQVPTKEYIHATTGTNADSIGADGLEPRLNTVNTAETIDIRGVLVQEQVSHGEMDTRHSYMQERPHSENTEQSTNAPSSTLVDERDGSVLPSVPTGCSTSYVTMDGSHVSSYGEGHSAYTESTDHRNVHMLDQSSLNYTHGSQQQPHDEFSPPDSAPISLAGYDTGSLVYPGNSSGISGSLFSGVPPHGAQFDQVSHIEVETPHTTADKSKKAKNKNKTKNKRVSKLKNVLGKLGSKDRNSLAVPDERDIDEYDQESGVTESMLSIGDPMTISNGNYPGNVIDLVPSPAVSVGEGEGEGEGTVSTENTSSQGSNDANEELIRTQNQQQQQQQQQRNLMKKLDPKSAMLKFLPRTTTNPDEVDDDNEKGNPVKIDFIPPQSSLLGKFAVKQRAVYPSDRPVGPLVQLTPDDILYQEEKLTKGTQNRIELVNRKMKARIVTLQSALNPQLNEIPAQQYTNAASSPLVSPNHMVNPILKLRPRVKGGLLGDLEKANKEKEMAKKMGYYKPGIGPAFKNEGTGSEVDFNQGASFVVNDPIVQKKLVEIQRHELEIEQLKVQHLEIEREKESQRILERRMEYPGADQQVFLPTHQGVISPTSPTGHDQSMFLMGAPSYMNPLGLSPATPASGRFSDLQSSTGGGIPASRRVIRQKDLSDPSDSSGEEGGDGADSDESVDIEDNYGANGIRRKPKAKRKVKAGRKIEDEKDSSASSTSEEELYVKPKKKNARGVKGRVGKKTGSSLQKTSNKKSSSTTDTQRKFIKQKDYSSSEEEYKFNKANNKNRHLPHNADQRQNSVRTDMANTTGSSVNGDITSASERGGSKTRSIKYSGSHAGSFGTKKTGGIKQPKNRRTNRASSSGTESEDDPTVVRKLREPKAKLTEELDALNALEDEFDDYEEESRGDDISISPRQMNGAVIPVESESESEVIDSSDDGSNDSVAKIEKSAKKKTKKQRKGGKTKPGKRGHQGDKSVVVDPLKDDDHFNIASNELITEEEFNTQMNNFQQKMMLYQQYQMHVYNQMQVLQKKFLEQQQKLLEKQIREEGHKGSGISPTFVSRDLMMMQANGTAVLTPAQLVYLQQQQQIDRLQTPLTPQEQHQQMQMQMQMTLQMQHQQELQEQQYQQMQYYQEVQQMGATPEILFSLEQQFQQQQQQLLTQQMQQSQAYSVNPVTLAEQDHDMTTQQKELMEQMYDPENYAKAIEHQKKEIKVMQERHAQQAQQFSPNRFMQIGDLIVSDTSMAVDPMMSSEVGNSSLIEPDDIETKVKSRWNKRVTVHPGRPHTPTDEFNTSLPPSPTSKSQVKPTPKRKGVKVKLRRKEKTFSMDDSKPLNIYDDRNVDREVENYNDDNDNTHQHPPAPPELQPLNDISPHTKSPVDIIVQDVDQDPSSTTTTTKTTRETNNIMNVPIPITSPIDLSEMEPTRKLDSSLLSPPGAVDLEDVDAEEEGEEEEVFHRRSRELEINELAGNNSGSDDNGGASNDEDDDFDSASLDEDKTKMRKTKVDKEIQEHAKKVERRMSNLIEEPQSGDKYIQQLHQSTSTKPPQQLGQSHKQVPVGLRKPAVGHRKNRLSLRALDQPTQFNGTIEEQHVRPTRRRAIRSKNRVSFSSGEGRDSSRSVSPAVASESFTGSESMNDNTMVNMSLTGSEEPVDLTLDEIPVQSVMVDEPKHANGVNSSSGVKPGRSRSRSPRRELKLAPQDATVKVATLEDAARKSPTLSFASNTVSSDDDLETRARIVQAKREKMGLKKKSAGRTRGASNPKPIAAEHIAAVSADAAHNGASEVLDANNMEFVDLPQKVGDRSVSLDQN